MDGLIDMEQKGHGLRQCGIHYMTLTFDFTHDIDLGFSRANLEIAVIQEWVVWGSFHYWESELPFGSLTNVWKLANQKVS